MPRESVRLHTMYSSSALSVLVGSDAPGVKEVEENGWGQTELPRWPSCSKCHMATVSCAGQESLQV